MIESLSIAVHAFVSRVSMSFSVDSHGKNAQPHDYMYVESKFLPYRGRDHP